MLASRLSVVTFARLVMAQVANVSFDAALARSILRHAPNKGPVSRKGFCEDSYRMAEEERVSYRIASHMLCIVRCPMVSPSCS